tara:strand:+ start:4102 stop:4365 length:264 start_codon:yes stop_codon:yes gene_type:complete
VPFGIPAVVKKTTLGWNESPVILLVEPVLPGTATLPTAALTSSPLKKITSRWHPARDDPFVTSSRTPSVIQELKAALFAAVSSKIAT